tara:strand:- start:264 stop:551 length:288 start_codon:yes stop_codon:yes gene_type:complete
MTYCEDNSLETSSDQKPEDEAPELSVVDIKNRLVAIGVNSTQGSYESEQKELHETFCSLPLPDIAPCWMFLKTDIKARIIDHHEDEFNKFVLGGE